MGTIIVKVVEFRFFFAIIISLFRFRFSRKYILRHILNIMVGNYSIFLTFSKILYMVYKYLGFGFFRSHLLENFIHFSLFYGLGLNLFIEAFLNPFSMLLILIYPQRVTEAGK